MRFFRRLIRILFGLIVMVLSLVIAGLLIAILTVLINFGGNATFPVDCAVVFGSAVRQGSEAGPGITRRVETAVHLLQEGSVRRLFFTGGIGEGNSASEAAVMRNVALRMGVSQNVIALEDEATSTWENIKFIHPHLKDCESTVGISDRYHLARIRLTAWKLGVPMALYPAERQANIPFEVVAVLRESVGMLIYATTVDER